MQFEELKALPDLIAKLQKHVVPLTKEVDFQKNGEVGNGKALSGGASYASACSPLKL